MISPKARATLAALTPADREELRRILAARATDRAHYLSPNAMFAAWVAKDSGASLSEGDGNMVDAGQTTGPANPALSTQPPAIVAWDLTLRCPACNSSVEGNVRKYHCLTCAIKKGGSHG